MLILAPVAWAAPERFWPIICNALARGAGFLVPARKRGLETKMPTFLASFLGGTIESAAIRVTSGSHQELVATLRAHHPGGWHPEVRLVGRDRLDAVLEEQHGVILWVGDFEFARLVAKMAFAQAGYKIHHLSRPQHGFSGSTFGIRYLNPIQTSVEARYLTERIVMAPGDTVSSLRMLYRRLSVSEIVSITVSENASQTRPVPLLDGMTRLATGPVKLARAIKAPLLPIFTIRNGPSSFNIYIESPLMTSGSPDDETPFQEYAQALASYVKLSPAAWRGWQKDWSTSF